MYSGKEVGSGCEGPGFNSSCCQLYRLGVRHFKISGGVPSSPEQPPGNRFKNSNGRLAESKQSIHILWTSISTLIGTDFPQRVYEYYV